MYYYSETGVFRMSTTVTNGVVNNNCPCDDGDDGGGGGNEDCDEAIKWLCDWRGAFHDSRADCTCDPGIPPGCGGTYVIFNPPGCSGNTSINPDINSTDNSCPCGPDESDDTGGGSGGGTGGGSGTPGNNCTGIAPCGELEQYDENCDCVPGTPISIVPINNSEITEARERVRDCIGKSSFWNNDDEITLSISNYIESNPCSNETSTFINEVIEFVENNPSYSFDYVVNNRTEFNSNQTEIDDYEDGGFDTTSYDDFNPQEDWPNITSVISVNDFVGWGAAGININCMDYAKAQIAKSGYQISAYFATGQTFQIYTTQNGVNNNALNQGLSYLKYALSNGIPVIVGIDDAPGSHNPQTDNTTDHFVVIVGMGKDSNGNYFQFYDNASSRTDQGTSSLNKLYYDPVTGLISGTSETNYANGLTYTLSMIRKSKPLN
jgi:hypothetical protein